MFRRGDNKEIRRLKTRHRELEDIYIQLKKRLDETEKLLLQIVRVVRLMDTTMSPVYIKYINERELEKLEKEKKQLEIDSHIYG